MWPFCRVVTYGRLNCFYKVQEPNEKTWWRWQIPVIHSDDNPGKISVAENIVDKKQLEEIEDNGHDKCVPEVNHKKLLLNLIIIK